MGFLVPFVLLLHLSLTDAARTVNVATDKLASDSGADSSLSAECKYACGVNEIEDVFDFGFDGKKRMTFQIGAGAKVTYKAKAWECLSQCRVVDKDALVKNATCDRMEPGTRKVAKVDTYKLCCAPKRCNFNPHENAYKRHEEGEQTKHTPFRSYKPLQDIEGVLLPARTCVCCSKKRKEMNWGPDIKRRCKKAYQATNVGNALRNVAHKVTGKASDSVSRVRCRAYCKSYDEYPYGFKSKVKRSLIAHEVIKPKLSGGSGSASNDDDDDDEEDIIENEDEYRSLPPMPTPAGAPTGPPSSKGQKIKSIGGAIAAEPR